MKQRLRTIVPAAFALMVVAAVLWLALVPVGQQPDRAYKPRVERPMFAKQRIVKIDEGHNNAHRLNGGYSPFARLLRADGLDVERHRGPFTRESLAGTDVLVVVNADGGSNPKMFGINLVFLRVGDRGSPAFTQEEVEAVAAWVRDGGSLLLIADHAPFGTAAAELSDAFGVKMHGGFAGAPPPYASKEDPGTLDFTRENALIGEHPTTRGRDASEGIARVRSFTGQSLDPGEATVILRLPAGSFDEFPNDPVQHIAGSAQGVALEAGRGRVVILGEAAMLTAQREGRARWGMSMAGIDNEQFALNVMRWLCRAI